MKKTPLGLISILFIAIVGAWIWFTVMPQWLPKEEPLLSDFSGQRALKHIEFISKKPHCVGSENHEFVGQYIITELEQLGLKPTLQVGTTLSKGGILAKASNIVATIKGTSNSKSLLLLSHYDSAPHSKSHGASDDASGVATILEGIRAFLHIKTPHTNDIIIVFSDAEELGLNGAQLFVNQNPLSKNVGVAINFEARGTSGPAYMLMETTGGNSQMVREFANSNPRFPVSNSLMYSIYKMLPNDTDLTVFREQGNIQGFNFAFIDGHFNYHTKQDDINHIDHRTVAHQGYNLMSLLKYFGNAKLSMLSSTDDQVYFNTPFSFFHYSNAWNLPLLIFSFLLFAVLIVIGIAKRILFPALISRGLVLFLCAVVMAAGIAFFGYKICFAVYPQFSDILQGFPYNGHLYIAGFVLISIAVGFMFYSNARNEFAILNYSIAPIAIWLIINTGLVLYLPGGSYFIIPIIFALIMLACNIITQHPMRLINLLCSIPAIIIFSPFIFTLPIGLGIKVIAGSAALTVLLFGLLLPIFGMFNRKGIWSIVFLISAIGCFIWAHFESGYEPGKAKPDSLVYIYNSDVDKAYWASYDNQADAFTKTYLNDKPRSVAGINQYQIKSKYGNAFKLASEALVREIVEPQVEFDKDSVVYDKRFVKIKITPRRNVNRYDIYASESLSIMNMKANGATVYGEQGHYKRDGRHVLTYFVSGNEPLSMQFVVQKDAILDLELVESSFDLMENPVFMMSRRPAWIMPKPFVINDAVMIIKKIKPTPKIIVPIEVQKNFSIQRAIETDTIQDPDEGFRKDLP